VIAIGNTSLEVSDDFTLTGIALGTIVVIVFYHLSRTIAPGHLRAQQDDQGTLISVNEPGMYKEDEIQGAHRSDPE
jgi:hypothetical protein